ncbi:unnamed protein product [Ilex paraguariensis]|uniref:Uncharacterized protein n=1 Tax=Ilex paraguariensis TaxID=185542 RepID=A0ABC8SHT6_9AQUA
MGKRSRTRRSPWGHPNSPRKTLGLNSQYMAGWSKIVDGSSLGCFKTLQKIQISDPLFTLELVLKGSFKDNEQDDLQYLFDQFLSLFLEEISGSNCFRPLPSKLGNVQSVDLVKLRLVVRARIQWLKSVCSVQVSDLQ